MYMWFNTRINMTNVHDALTWVKLRLFTTSICFAVDFTSMRKNKGQSIVEISKRHNGAS